MSAGVGSEDVGGDVTEKEMQKLKQDIEAESRARDTLEWTNMELERSVRMMEKSVQQLEMGNFESDESEPKQKYEGQKQINVQLQEQKKWLEHELEEIKIKIANDKINQVPDMLLDWDKLSETELKRLVSQLEKTRNDLRSDISDVEYRLDKEGKEYHHHEEFAQMYRAEVKSLTRTLDQLQRHGAQIGVPLPGLPGSGSNLKDQQLYSANGMGSDGNTPGGWMPGSYPMSRKHSELIRSPSPTRKRSPSPPPRRTSKTSKSPSVSNKSSSQQSPSPSRKVVENGTTKIDPKLGTQRKTAGVRNLPKLDRSSRRTDKDSKNGRASSNSKSPKKSPSKRPGKARNGNVKENTAKENGGESVAEENGETLGEENGGVRSAASSKSGESSNGNELNPVEEEEQ